MSASYFAQRDVKPDAQAVNKALGKTAKHWQETRTYAEEKYGPTQEEWKYYNVRSGWLMKLLLKKRNLFFFVPLKGGFRLSFVFGDRAVAEIMTSKVKDEVKEQLKQAKKYMEGTGISLPVKTSGDVKTAKLLLDIKMAN